MSFEAALAEYKSTAESLKNDLLAMPEEKWTESVGGSFNALETLAHLAHVEDMYLGVIEKRSDAKWSHKRPGPNFLYRQVCKTLVKGKQIPAPKSFHPQTTVETIQEGIDLWNQTSQRIENCLTHIPDTETAARHPLFGRMSRFHVVEILKFHTEYHRQRLPL